MTEVFIPGIGFSDASTRFLAAPVTVTRGGEMLIVNGLVADAAGTALELDISVLDHATAPRPAEASAALGVIRAVDERGREYRPHAHAPRSMGFAGGRLHARLVLQPFAADVERVDLLVGSAAGEWRVPLSLRAGSEAGVPIRASVGEARVQDIRVTVEHVARMADRLAIHLSAVPEHPRIRFVRGIGRDMVARGPGGATVIDAAGRVWGEVEAAVANPGPVFDGAQRVLMFEGISGLPLRLLVPYVVVQEDAPDATVAVADLPRTIRFGGYVVWLGAPQPSRLPDRMRIPFAAGDWVGDARLLRPEGVLVDGSGLGFSFQTEPDMRIEAIEVPPADSLTLQSPVIQLRGRWEIALD